MTTLKSTAPFSPPAGYMDGLLDDLTNENLAAWVKSAADKWTRYYDGYLLRDSIDGRRDPDREVTFATITGPLQLKEHRHKKSDALFIVVGGTATLRSNGETYRLEPGDRLAIPRGMPHGFSLERGEQLSFVSVQSPPIRNRQSGEEDFHPVEPALVPAAMSNHDSSGN